MTTRAELFRLRKGTRVLVCCAVQWPEGTEIRLEDDLGLLRSRVVRTDHEAQELLDKWRERARENGWTVLPASDE